MAAPSTTSTGRLTDWERDIIKRARQLSRDGVRSAEAQALARELLRQLADLAERLGGDT